ncbi:hypothetical protein HXP44_15345 [Streptomyces sioyaensis]|uniref:Uncharacterized protein n=1 Tax=Streptomyces sioyaensis TaxID=67364 RepID=A0A4Q1QMU0_9ACTN|nr:hypothetical protein [Streptomyces sioyaensis]MBM4793393.1 hypothetical protein [Streptomyces sioyaensis]RXS59884.1 hypothetical protein EST54_28755 [Streptomyces sioyaensis]
MHAVRRSAALTLLLLLAVTFGPLLCRIGGDQAWLAGRAATAAAQWRTGLVAAHAADAAHANTTGVGATPPADAAAPSRPAVAHGGPQLDDRAPLAVAAAPKRCSNRHAPAPSESAPLPAPHRGEPLAPATTGAGPRAADLPAQHARARPPTGSAPAVDHTSLLPVLRI